MNRIKKWIQFNKAGVIWIAIILVYTMIMGGIILCFGSDLVGCSSGSLTGGSNSSNIETSVGSGS